MVPNMFLGMLGNVFRSYGEIAINNESKEHARIDDQTFGLLIVRVHAIFEVLDLLGIAGHSGLIDFFSGSIPLKEYGTSRSRITSVGLIIAPNHPEQVTRKKSKCYCARDMQDARRSTSAQKVFALDKNHAAGSAAGGNPKVPARVFEACSSPVSGFVN